MTAVPPPPVQQVRLVLYFPTLAIDPIDLDGIRSLWSEYAKITQLPPLEGDDEDEDEDSGHEHLWPLAFTAFESGPLGESIIYQGDRFAVDWHSEGTELPYPGYESMKKILRQRYTEFLDVIIRNGSPSLSEPSRVEALYVNEVPDRSAEDVALRVILGPDAPLGEKQEDRYDSFRRHQHWGDREAAWLTATDIDPGVRVTIKATAESGVSLEGWPERLDSCHDQVHLFYRSSLGE